MPQACSNLCQMREFRSSKAGLYFGLIFTCIALVLPYLLVKQFVSGERLMVGNTHDPGSMHKMTYWELMEFSVAGICLVGFGLMAIVDWKNSVYQTTSSGIRKLSTFRKVTFTADWGDLKSATKRKGQNGAVVYAIATADNELIIPDSKSLSELRRQSRESSPHLNFSAWKGS